MVCSHWSIFRVAVRSRWSMFRVTPLLSLVIFFVWRFFSTLARLSCGGTLPLVHVILTVSSPLLQERRAHAPRLVDPCRPLAPISLVFFLSRLTPDGPAFAWRRAPICSYFVLAVSSHCLWREALASLLIGPCLPLVAPGVRPLHRF